MFENRTIPTGVQLLYKLHDTYESEMSYTIEKNFVPLYKRETNEFVLDELIPNIKDFP